MKSWAGKREKSFKATSTRKDELKGQPVFKIKFAQETQQALVPWVGGGAEKEKA